MLRFFSSIRNAIWFFCISIFFFFCGVLIIPNTMQLYTNIVDTLLIKWLAEVSPAVSWWVIGLMVSMGLIATSTLICSIETIRKKLPKGEPLKVLAPHVVHLGVLAMLLGHLLTSVYGMQVVAVLKEGERFNISRELDFVVDKIIIGESKKTELTWEVTGNWIASGQQQKYASIKPVHPSRFGLTYLFIKSADKSSLKAVLMARSDIGAYFIALGSGIFALGAVMLALARRRKKEALA